MTAEEAALKHLRRMLCFIVNEDDTVAIQTAITALERSTAYQKAFEDIRAELTNNHRASERRYWTYYDLMELLDKHNPDKVGKEGKE